MSRERSNLGLVLGLGVFGFVSIGSGMYMWGGKEYLLNYINWLLVLGGVGSVLLAFGLILEG